MRTCCRLVARSPKPHTVKAVGFVSLGLAWLLRMIVTPPTGEVSPIRPLYAAPMCRLAVGT